MSAKLNKSNKAIVFLLAVLTILFLAIPVFHEEDEAEIFPVPLINQAQISKDKPLLVTIPNTVEKISVLPIALSEENLNLFVDDKNSVEVANLAQGKMELRLVNENGDTILSHEVNSHRKCIDASCVIVTGEGVDGCETNLDCIQKTDLNTILEESTDKSSNKASSINLDGYDISVVESEQDLTNRNDGKDTLDDTKTVKRELFISVASHKGESSTSLEKKKPDDKNTNYINLILDVTSGNPLAITFNMATAEPTITPTPNSTAASNSENASISANKAGAEPTAVGTTIPSPSNQFRKCVEGYCSRVYGAGINECETDNQCGHRVCSYDRNQYYCKRVPGPGTDLCNTDAQCNYKVCSVGLCTLAGGTGQPVPDKDQCSRSVPDCGHMECSVTNLCEIFPGKGEDKCSNNSDCGHKECDVKSGRCSRAAGKGADKCSRDTDCGHKECNANGFCSWTPGVGPHKCQEEYSRSECSHRDCTNGVCDYVNGQGVDTCDDNTKCRHKVCHNKQCKTFNERGEDNCFDDYDCTHYKACSFSGYCKDYVGTGPDECQNDKDCHWFSSSRDNTNDKNARAQLTSENKADLTSNSKSIRSNVSNSTNFDSNFTKPNYIHSNAKVKLEIFQDVNCGMCKFAYNNLYQGLIEDYVSKGLVSLEIKEYPLIPREKDVRESSSLICAADQDKYGSYLDKVYKWNTKENGDRDLLKIAEEVFLDTKKFTECLESPLTKVKIDNYINEGKERAIDGTPTIILNGTTIGGAMDYDKFKKFIDDALKG